jgi:hypothetical protein
VHLIPKEKDKLVFAVQVAQQRYMHISDREIGKDINCDDNSSMARYWSINTPDKEFAFSPPDDKMLTVDNCPRIGDPTYAMITLNTFHQDQIGGKQYWCHRQKNQTPMKPLYEYGSQVAGCRAEGKDGYFHPILGRTNLITPGLKIARTPNNYTVIEPEDHEKHRSFGYSPDKEVNMSLAVDLESDEEESSGENEFKRWLFDAGALVHITRNKRKFVQLRKYCTGDTRR